MGIEKTANTNVFQLIFYPTNTSGFFYPIVFLNIEFHIAKSNPTFLAHKLAYSQTDCGR